MTTSLTPNRNLNTAGSSEMSPPKSAPAATMTTACTQSGALGMTCGTKAMPSAAKYIWPSWPMLK